MCRRIAVVVVMLLAVFCLAACSPKRPVTAQQRPKDLAKLVKDLEYGVFRDPAVQLVYEYRDGFLVWVSWEELDTLYDSTRRGGEWNMQPLQGTFTPLIKSRSTVIWKPYQGSYLASAGRSAGPLRLPPFVWGVIGSKDVTDVVLRNTQGGSMPPNSKAYLENGFFVIPFTREAAHPSFDVFFLDKSGRPIKALSVIGETMKELDINTFR